MLRRVLVVLALCVPLVLVTEPASAEPVCVEENPRTGKCLIWAEDPGSGDEESGGGGEDDGGSGGGSGGGGGSDADRTCSYFDEEIHCNSSVGVWNGTCYVKVVDPQPEKNDPVWEGHEDGVIVSCTSYLCVDQPDRAHDPTCPDHFLRWLPALPGADGPSAVDLAQRAVAQMTIHAVDIGIVPEEGPDRIGIVGMPTWMWVADPGVATLGPITRSASAGGATVTATAQVDRIVWDMGDGSTVTCVGPGTPYEDRYDTSDSPDCGHRYTKQGEYEVTATSYWTVQWEGMGQSGTIPLDFTSTANIVMGEAQVITQ